MIVHDNFADLHASPQRTYLHLFPIVNSKLIVILQAAIYETFHAFIRRVPNLSVIPLHAHWQIQPPVFFFGGGGANSGEVPTQGTPKTENSTDLIHYFLGWTQIHFRKQN